MHRILFLAALLLVTPAQAQERDCRALDGDTIACGAERIRIRSIDAPEMRGRCPSERRAARASRDRLDELLAEGVTIERRGRDKYRRTLGLLRDDEGQSIAEIMVREGHARPYSGRTRRLGWCGAAAR